MTDPDHGGAASAAEMTSIPVKGDCGHAFPVPLARLLDGAPFSCPACGHKDHIDVAALKESEEQLRRLRDSGLSHDLQSAIDSILARAQEQAR